MTKYLPLSFSIIGIGYLFPFSAMTQPIDYWTLNFPNYTILYHITATFMISNLLTLLLMIGLTRDLNHLLLVRRIYLGFMGQCLTLAMVPVIHYLPINEEQRWLLILLLTSLMAIFTALLDASVIAFSSLYSTKCQSALQIGVGLSTLIGSIYRLLTKLVFPNSEWGVEWSSVLYFVVGCLSLLLCLFCFRNVLRHHDVISTTTTTETEPLLNTNTTTTTNNNTEVSKSNCLWKCLPLGLSLTFLFLTTLTIWPSLLSTLHSYNFPSLNQSKWFPLLLLFLFSLSDVIGRLLTNYHQYITPKTIQLPILLRLLFTIPLFLSQKQIYFTSDIYTLLSTFILGLTNGYCGSLCILFMNQIGTTEGEKRVIGAMSGMFLNIGLVLGSVSGLLLEIYYLN